MTIGVALPQRRDLIDPPATPTSVMPEADLWHAYARSVSGEDGLGFVEPIVEPCACGRDIALYPGESLGIVYAVHVETIEHRAWSAATRWR